jgi:hypothetical protein
MDFSNVDFFFLPVNFHGSTLILLSLVISISSDFFLAALSAIIFAPTFTDK